jgi:putative nucleotidyltransferase with HDIG domain
LDAQGRLERIAEFVKNRLEESKRLYPAQEHDAVYRWEHTLRVARYGEKIARAEGADVETAVAACLLHDVAHFEPMANHKNHGRIGALISRSLLMELGYPEEQVENTCYAIAVHVDGEAGFENPETMFGKIVSDADNVDRFSAFRTLLYCLPEMGDFRSMAEKLHKRIERLEGYLEDNPLETESGRALFAKQIARQIRFFRDLIADYEFTSLPRL